MWVLMQGPWPFGLSDQESKGSKTRRRRVLQSSQDTVAKCQWDQHDWEAASNSSIGCYKVSSNVTAIVGTNHTAEKSAAAVDDTTKMVLESLYANLSALVIANTGLSYTNPK